MNNKNKSELKDTNNGSNENGEIKQFQSTKILLKTVNTKTKMLDTVYFFGGTNGSDIFGDLWILKGILVKNKTVNMMKKNEFSESNNGNKNSNKNSSNNDENNDGNSNENEDDSNTENDNDSSIITEDESYSTDNTPKNKNDKNDENDNENEVEEEEEKILMFWEKSSAGQIRTFFHFFSFCINKPFIYLSSVHHFLIL